MPNPMYIKGVAKERKIVNDARAAGLIALRAAGSHSPFDVVIIDKEKNLVQFIQCKSTSIAESAVKVLDNKYSWLNGLMNTEFLVYQ